MVVSNVFNWAYKTSIYIYKHVKPIAIKTHNRKAYSYFKYGFHFLTNALLVTPHKLIIFSNVLSDT